jgi:leader peptidase (prepilin peptidase)/N-methyltransferase
MLINAFVFFFGAMIGSFLNVCIFRIPKEESIVFPASHCQKCLKPIAWHDNVPVISFVVLKGKCRNCSQKISWQYPFIELITGLLFVLFYSTFGISLQGVVYLIFSLALLVCTVIDWHHQIIPDAITLPGMVLGLVISAAFPSLHGQDVFWKGLLSAFLGLLVGGGFLYASAVAAEFFLKKEAMGGGDIKLLGLIGTIIGWQGSVWTIFVSSVLGSILGLWLRFTQKKEYFPFGPAIAAAAFIYLFYGQRAISWYLGLYSF